MRCAADASSNGSTALNKILSLPCSNNVRALLEYSRLRAPRVDIAEIRRRGHLDVADADVAQPRVVDIGELARCRQQRRDPAVHAHRPKRLAERCAADGVQNHIDTASIGPAQHLFDEVLLPIIDR